MLHNKIRRDAKSLMVHGLVPNVKHGGKVKPDLKQKFQDYVGFMRTESRKKNFVPSGIKSKKMKINVNESFGGSRERWDSQRTKDAGRKKDNYIKEKSIDYNAIIEKMDVPETLRITGSRFLLGDPNAKANIPDAMVLNQQLIRWLLEKNTYISTESVDAGLMLLDKRIEDSNMKENFFCLPNSYSQSYTRRSS